jgi:hypothetical protein
MMERSRSGCEAGGQSSRAGTAGYGELEGRGRGGEVDERGVRGGRIERLLGRRGADGKRNWKEEEQV